MNQKRSFFLLLHYYFPPLSGAVTKRAGNIVKYIGTVSHYDPVVVTSSSELIHFGYDYQLYTEMTARSDIYSTFSLDPLYLFSRLTKRSSNKQTSLHGLPWSKILHETYTFWKNFFFIGDDKILWTPFVIRKVSRIVKRYPLRLIYTTFPPAGNLYTALWLKKIYNIPLIIDYRDPWYYNSSALRYKTHVHFFFEEICEKNLLRETDGVIFNSPDTREKYLKIYPFLKNKLNTVIVNGYESFVRDERRTEHSKIHFIASGTMLRERSVTPFLEHLQHLSESGLISPDKIQCTLCGVIDSSLETRLQADPFYNKHVNYLGNLSSTEALEKIKEADIAVACLNDSKRDDIILNKLFDYMSRDKFILFIGNSRASRRLLEEYGKSASFEVDDEISIRQFLQKLLHNPQNILNIPSRISPDKYRTDTMVREMGVFFDKVITQNSVN